MDVDNTRGAGASVWFRADGIVEIDHDLIVQSHLKAQGIGAYNSYLSGMTAIATGASGSVTKTCAGQIAVGCSYESYRYMCLPGCVYLPVTSASSLQTTRYEINPSGGSCTIDFMNNSAGTIYAQIDLECWDTNG
jgi:hypothetical protein